MGGSGWGGRFVGCVCSRGWIVVEIQHLIYQYKMLKNRGKNFPLLSFFFQSDSSNAVLFWCLSRMF